MSEERSRRFALLHGYVEGDKARKAATKAFDFSRPDMSTYDRACSGEEFVEGAHINPGRQPGHGMLYPDCWKPLLLHQTLGSNQVCHEYDTQLRAGIREQDVTKGITERLCREGIPDDWKLANFLRNAAKGKSYESYSWSKALRSATRTVCIATPVKNNWKPWLQSLLVMGRKLPKEFIDWLPYNDGENIHHVAVTVAKMARVWLTYDPYDDYDPFDVDAQPDPRDDPEWSPFVDLCDWIINDGEFMANLNAAKIGPRYRISGGPSTTNEDEVDPQSFFADVDWKDASRGAFAEREGLVVKILSEMTAERREMFLRHKHDDWDSLLAEQQSVIIHVDNEVAMYYWRRMQEFVTMFVNELSIHAVAKQVTSKSIARCRPQRTKERGVADFTPDGSRYDWDPRRDLTPANKATSYEDWVQNCVAAGVEPDLCSQSVVGFYWECDLMRFVDTETVYIPGVTTSLHSFSWDIGQAAKQGSYLHAFSISAYDDYCSRTRFGRDEVTPDDTLVPFIGKTYKDCCTFVTMHFEPRAWQRLRWVQMFEAEQDLASNAWLKLEESFRALRQMLDEQSNSWRKDPDILTSGLLRDADEECRERYCLMCTFEFCNFWYKCDKSEVTLPTRALYSGDANDASLHRVMERFEKQTEEYCTKLRLAFAVSVTTLLVSDLMQTIGEMVVPSLVGHMVTQKDA